MVHNVKLSTWAEMNDYSYEGAYRRFRRGDIPGAFQDPQTKTIFVAVEQETNQGPKDRAVIYSRVSTAGQKDHLKAQTERNRSFAVAKGLRVVKEVEEIGSGINDKRPKLLSLMESKDTWDVMVVEYKDRLSRFGTTFLEGWAKATGREIIFVNTSQEGDTESLTEDLLSIITVFSGRLYGKRGAKNRASKAMEQLKD